MCVEAAAETRQFLTQEAQWDHRFGLETGEDGTVYGKMFGVLVVSTPDGKVGYLRAFSGKLGGRNHYPGFVPPVFDLLDENGFYRLEEDRISAINHAIEALEKNPEWLAQQEEMEKISAEAERETAAVKNQNRQAKAGRDLLRKAAKGEMPASDRQALEEKLSEESQRDHFRLKDLKRHWKEKIEWTRQGMEARQEALQRLKEERKKRSAAVQQQIFERFRFLNCQGEEKSLAEIFRAHHHGPPPSGAGECAAPKLLQYAFLHGLKPLALAEFWWGASPSGEIRKHGHFYPACRGKCGPILAHVLLGMNMDPNPLEEQHQASEQADLAIVYEDTSLLVLNKPHHLPAVPGKMEGASVVSLVRGRYPDATGPLVVHRLDMATSGLMLVAKNEIVYKHLQQQFTERTVKKRYTAVLAGILPQDAGFIELPLRVDLDDRPRQMVCYEHGKPARTEWKVTERSEQTTRVHFYPVTGRTHQLRVHAAHPAGLNAPIVGDDLYGTPADRLYLHAEYLELTHPVTGARIIVEAKAEF